MSTVSWEFWKIHKNCHSIILLQNHESSSKWESSAISLCAKSTLVQVSRVSCNLAILRTPFCLPPSRSRARSRASFASIAYRFFFYIDRHFLALARTTTGPALARARTTLTILFPFCCLLHSSKEIFFFFPFFFFQKIF